jgi:hypothetical protein
MMEDIIKIVVGFAVMLGVPFLVGIIMRDENQKREVAFGKTKLFGESGKMQTLSKPESAGTVITCPRCKAVVPPFTTRCTNCDFDFRSVESSQNAQQLLSLLMDIDNAQTVYLSRGLFDISTQQMNKRIAYETARRKASVISSFPVLSNKEDILEFLTQGFTKAKKAKTGISKILTWGIFPKLKIEQIVNTAWEQKFEEIVIRARISMENDVAMLDKINAYAKELNL